MKKVSRKIIITVLFSLIGLGVFSKVVLADVYVDDNILSQLRPSQNTVSNEVNDVEYPITVENSSNSLTITVENITTNETVNEVANVETNRTSANLYKGMADTIKAKNEVIHSNTEKRNSNEALYLVAIIMVCACAIIAIVAGIILFIVVSKNKRVENGVMMERKIEDRKDDINN